MGLEILVSVIAFTAVVLVIVAALLVAERKLVAQGDLNINVNGEKDLTTGAGGNLLTTLSGQKIFLPSACGGGGTCAMCKCKVLEGGGEILPTETGYITRKEAQEGWRLACQVKIKEDMKIEVPEEVFGIKKFRCKVRSNENVATFIKELILEIQDGETLDFEAGGYIQIDIPEYKNLSYKSFDVEEEYRDEWDRYNLWQFTANNDEDCFRAYSMANHPAEGQIVMLNVRIASPPPNLPDAPPGIASSYIFDLKPGDEVIVSGPYGEFFQQQTQREMCFIGGGAGMAPMRSHLFDLFHTQKTDRKVSFWYGARSKREMFYDDQFKDIEKDFPNFTYRVGLSDPQPEDNWDGHVGFIHQVLLDNYLSNHPAPEDVEYYLCGPPMMNSAVFKMLDDLGVDDEMIRFDDFG
ncbi:MAG: NADH:ubiquinone reductase (Na(+)-transporting) subunit F [Myxococcota bacterium]|jgi:Na+-transporting NADH:ubiquinone oxidoreductase subunit F|nr:NADH:ubiquinone reductase (Na(+)-transporting) subunit F [Myxococcota bacterium]